MRLACKHPDSCWGSRQAAAETNNQFVCMTVPHLDGESDWSHQTVQTAVQSVSLTHIWSCSIMWNTGLQCCSLIISYSPTVFYLIKKHQTLIVYWERTYLFLRWEELQRHLTNPLIVQPVSRFSICIISIVLYVFNSSIKKTWQSSGLSSSDARFSLSVWPSFAHWLQFYLSSTVLFFCLSLCCCRLSAIQVMVIIEGWLWSNCTSIVGLKEKSFFPQIQSSRVFAYLLSLSHCVFLVLCLSALLQSAGAGATLSTGDEVQWFYSI